MANVTDFEDNEGSEVDDEDDADDDADDDGCADEDEGG